MKTVVEIGKLIQRLENLTAPDREVDALIAVAMFPTAYDGLNGDHVYAKPTRRDDHCAPGTYWCCSRSGMSLHTAPEYTRRVDAIQGAIAALQARGESPT